MKLKSQDRKLMEEVDLKELDRGAKHKRAYRRASIGVVGALLASITWLAVSFYQVITLRKESGNLKSESTRLSDLISRRKMDYDEIENHLKAKLQLTSILPSL